MASNVITDIESKNKATQHLNLGNLFFIVGYMMVAYMLRGMVHDFLRLPYLLFSLACSIYLSMPSRYNQGRNNLESLLLLLRADRTVYRPYVGGAL